MDLAPVEVVYFNIYTVFHESHRNFYCIYAPFHLRKDSPKFLPILFAGALVRKFKKSDVRL